MHRRVGDTLVVWKFDRLGCSLKHVIETVTLVHERGIGFERLTEQIDTTAFGGKLISMYSERLPSLNVTSFGNEPRQGWRLLVPEENDVVGQPCWLHLSSADSQARC